MNVLWEIQWRLQHLQPWDNSEDQWLLVWMIAAPFAVFFGVRAILIHKRNLRELTALAKELNVEFYPGQVGLDFSSGVIIEDLGPFNIAFLVGRLWPIKNQGCARAQRLMWGTVDGVFIWAFNYSYGSTFGRYGWLKAQFIRDTFKVVVAELPFAGGRIDIKPLHLGHRMARRIGLGGVDFGDPQFAKRFMVRASDEDYARAVLTPEVRQYLLSSKPYRWQIDQGYVLRADYHHMNARFCRVTIGELVGFVKRVPKTFEIPFTQPASESEAAAPR